LESVRAAQKDVAIARAQRRGGLPEDDVDLIVPYLASDLQVREVAPHGEPAGPHIAGVRRGGKLIDWERFERVALQSTTSGGGVVTLKIRRRWTNRRRHF
jgi:hypothetical protein